MKTSLIVTFVGIQIQTTAFFFPTPCLCFPTAKIKSVQIVCHCINLEADCFCYFIHCHRNPHKMRTARFSSTTGTQQAQDLPRAQLSAWICIELQCDLSIRCLYGKSPLLVQRHPAHSLTTSFKVRSSQQSLHHMVTFGMGYFLVVALLSVCFDWFCGSAVIHSI